VNYFCPNHDNQNQSDTAYDKMANFFIQVKVFFKAVTSYFLSVIKVSYRSSLHYQDLLSDGKQYYQIMQGRPLLSLNLLRIEFCYAVPLHPLIVIQ
jgi:hypothetical protein